MKNILASILSPVIAFINFVFGNINLAIDTEFLRSVKIWLANTGMNDTIAAILGVILIFYWIINSIVKLKELFKKK